MKYCEKINIEDGSCFTCKEGYYLNLGDKKCTKIENCYESTFGTCIKCKEGYYLNKKEEKCLQQTDDLSHCIETIDGKTCSTCEENYYLDKDEKCISINYCSKSNKNGKCEKCIEGYYLTNYQNACTQEKNCLSGDKDYGICYSCQGEYYLDLKDRKCKSNQEDNKLKYCEEVDESGICKKCIKDYKLGEDNKCCLSQYCDISENQICKQCIDGYHLGLDNLCSDIEFCIYSNQYSGQCIECKENYYYNNTQRECIKAEGNFINCKSIDTYELCQECRNDYYLNQTDKLCYTNKEKGDFYKCALTTPSGEKCMTCQKNYYLGTIDNKCTTIEGCQVSENENKCKQCFDYNYCLDSKLANVKKIKELFLMKRNFIIDVILLMRKVLLVKNAYLIIV